MSSPLSFCFRSLAFFPGWSSDGAATCFTTFQSHDNAPNYHPRNLRAKHIYIRDDEPPAWKFRFRRNHPPADRLAAFEQEISAMADDNPHQPYIYEGLDPVPEPKSAIAEASEAVKGTIKGIGDAIETGRRPGMPLSVLSNIAREAPLGSLLVAFLLGVIVARR
jgi:hypothetical protein